MKIKNIILGAFLVAAYSSCDKIDAPYREQVATPDFCATGIDDSIPNRKVLVEDYTGHLCGNCPDAGVYLNDTLKGIYNHCIVVISVHAGYFAGTCPTALACPGNQPAGAFQTDFNTTPGSAWNTFFGITGNPKGMVNRVGYPTATHSKAVSAWAGEIANQIALPAQAKIKITNNFVSATNSVNVSVQSDVVENLSGDYKLQVVITEDSVIDWQEWYNHAPEFVPDYIHHHVMRDVLNTTWGENLFTGGAASGASVTKNYSYTINNAWNVNHCNIVAFIYDANTYQVIQTEEAAVK
jgi:hypothetical protein